MSLSVLHICFSALLGCMVANALPRTQQDVAYGASSCETLENSICGRYYGIPWNASFPNRGLDRVASIKEFSDYISILSLDNYCSNRLHALLCWHYFPLCSHRSDPDSGTDTLVIARPCREVCLEAEDVCRPHIENLVNASVLTRLEHLNCSNFQLKSSQDESSGQGSSTSGSLATSEVTVSEVLACPTPSKSIYIAGRQCS